MLGARPSSTPLHHQCEGRPPAFQASRATRATNRAVASAACLEGPRGARYPICGCIGRRHSLRPLIFWANGSCKTRTHRAARSRSCILQLGAVIARSDLSAVAQRAKAEATKQSTLTSRQHGLLRFARNDDLKTILAV